MTSTPASNSPPTEQTTNSTNSPVKPESLVSFLNIGNSNASDDTGFVGNDSKTARIGVGNKDVNSAALNLPITNHQGWKCIGSRVKLTGRPPLVYHHQQQATQAGNAPAQSVGSASSFEAHNYNQRSFPMPKTSSSVKNTVVDFVDGDYEDPFQLESFESLIKSHQEHGKDFILARVITAAGQASSGVTEPAESELSDAEQQLFHNYYSAHQINRVLFRTQPEEGLLHRMKAKNPMNNLTIVGDVHYYRVLANQNSHASRSNKFICAKCDKPLPMNGCLDQQGLETADQLQPLNTTDPINKSSIVASSDVKKPSQIPTSKFSNGNFTRPPTPPPENQNELSATSPNEKENDDDDDDQPVEVCECYRDADTDQESTDSSPRPYYELIVAEYLATDDDFLMRRHIRQYFKQQALQPEDVFLFTLFGQQRRQQQNQQQQQSGTLAAVFGLVGQAAPADNALASSNAPLVSDPTNPNAVAMPLDQAIVSFEQQQTSFSASNNPAETNTPAEASANAVRGQQTPTSSANARQNITLSLNHHQPAGGFFPSGIIQRVFSGLNLSGTELSNDQSGRRRNSGNPASSLFGRRRWFWRQRRQNAGALQLTENSLTDASPRFIDPNSPALPEVNTGTNSRDDPNASNNDDDVNAGSSSPSNLIGAGSQESRSDTLYSRQRQINLASSHQNQDGHLTSVQTQPGASTSSGSSNSRQPSQGFLVMVMAMTILTGIALIIRLTWS